MKKIFTSLLILSITFSLLKANDFLNMDSFQNFSNNSKVEEKKKRYSELINFLETSNNGEYFFYLASIYTNGIPEKDSYGETVKKDTTKAIYFFNESIKKGFFLSSAVLGSLYIYHEDFIVQKNNVKKSEYYLNLALKNKIYDSTTILADLYFNYKNNPKEALKVLSIGAENKISTAQLALATIYNSGYENKDFSIKKNSFLSSKYLTDACTNKKATKKVKEICSSNSVDKIKE